MSAFILAKLEHPVFVNSTRAKWAVAYRNADGEWRFEFFPLKQQALQWIGEQCRPPVPGGVIPVRVIQ